jgi:4-amino-4-deoxy-L-arabinose transferase-like glycosyltransferase
MEWLDRLLARPLYAITVLCVLQIAVWTALPPLASQSPPLDAVENYLWGREWVILSYEHPQLPAWLLEASRLLTGSVRWPEYLLSQLFVCATYVLVYLLVRDLMGPRLALASVLLMPTLYWFGWLTYQFNHNIAQMPFWAALVFALWRAIEENRLRWWLLVAAAAGLGLYAKFSTGILIGLGGLWVLIDPKARGRLMTPQPWIGLAACLLLVAPLAIGLVRMDFLPLRYATARAEEVGARFSHFHFILVQIAGHGGLLVAMIVTGLLRRRPAPDAVVQAPWIAPRAFRYLLFFGLLPGLLVAIASLLTGVDEAWATPMFNLSGAIVIALLANRLTMVGLRRMAIVALIFLVGYVTEYVGRIVVRDRAGRAPVRVLWPQAEMATRMETIWHDATGKPLKIVGGDNWTAMVTALSMKDQPSIFTDLDMTLAPWITPERLKHEGMLLVWTSPESPERVNRWLGDRPIGHVNFVWSRNPAAEKLKIAYAIIPPEG